MKMRISLFAEDHLKELAKWGKHQDIRFIHYDFDGFEEIDYKRWFRRKQRVFTRKLFGIWDDKTLVGFITLKDINWFKRTAYVGLVFNPDTLGRGYGTAGLKLFVSHVFSQYAIDTLSLKVADFNRRAIACYKKSGFVLERTVLEPFETQENTFELLTAEPAFSLKGKKLLVYVHTMSIKRDWHREKLML